MRRYTQLEVQILKAAGYSIKEIARMDKDDVHYCNIWYIGELDKVMFDWLTRDPRGEEVEYAGDRYFIEWVG